MSRRFEVIPFVPKAHLAEKDDSRIDVDAGPPKKRRKRIVSGLDPKTESCVAHRTRRVSKDKTQAWNLDVLLECLRKTLGRYCFQFKDFANLRLTNRSICRLVDGGDSRLPEPKFIYDVDPMYRLRMFRFDPATATFPPFLCNADRLPLFEVFPSRIPWVIDKVREKNPKANKFGFVLRFVTEFKLDLHHLVEPISIRFFVRKEDRIGRDFYLRLFTSRDSIWYTGIVHFKVFDEDWLFWEMPRVRFRFALKYVHAAEAARDETYFDMTINEFAFSMNEYPEERREEEELNYRLYGACDSSDNESDIEMMKRYDGLGPDESPKDWSPPPVYDRPFSNPDEHFSICPCEMEHVDFETQIGYSEEYRCCRHMHEKDHASAARPSLEDVEEEEDRHDHHHAPSAKPDPAKSTTEPSTSTSAAGVDTNIHKGDDPSESSSSESSSGSDMEGYFSSEPAIYWRYRPVWWKTLDLDELSE